MNYSPEKWIWSEEDFDEMGWHDCKIFGISPGPGEDQLSLDVDYIWKWVHPSEGENFFKFWISPVTLVFENVHQLECEFREISVIRIDEVGRVDPRRPRNAQFIGKETEWRWTIDCHDGSINFWAVGYRQYTRKLPVLSDAQQLSLSARGGLSVSRCDEPSPE